MAVVAVHRSNSDGTEVLHVFATICRRDHLGVSENSVPLNPMVLLIIIPIKWLFHWEY